MKFNYVQGLPMEVCEKLNEVAKQGEVTVIATEYIGGKFLVLYQVDEKE